MDYAKEYKQEIAKAQSVAGVNATIGMVVVNELQEIINTLKRIEQAWVAPQSVDVVGHPGLSRQVQSAAPFKADKVKKGPKAI
jgi:hypothetical protein